MALNIIMLIAVASVLYLRYRQTRVAATPMNLFILRSVLMLFVTYPFLHEGLKTIRWSGISDIIAASEQALLICSLGAAIFLTSAILVPRLILAAGRRRSDTAGVVTGRRNETSEAYAACLVIVAGSALIWFTFAQTGIIPFLAEQPSKARTFAETYETYAAVRPLYQMGNTICGLSMAFLTAWCLTRRSSIRIPVPVLASLGLAIGTLFLTANRSWVLNPLLQGFMVYFAIRWRKAGVAKLIAIGFLIMVIALGLQIVRRGNFTVETLKGVPMEFAAGNTFSDFRDFSWVLTEFNRRGFDFYYGKTIAAGYLGFVPSSISPFRHKYAWGRVTTEITGLDPEAMFGLRPGPFGEWYFNFGWLGTVFQALLLGTLAGLIDTIFVMRVKRMDAEDPLPPVYPVFTLWMIFSIVCGPLALSSSAPGVIPQIGALLAITAIAAMLRNASLAARASQLPGGRKPAIEGNTE